MSVKRARQFHTGARRLLALFDQIVAIPFVSLFENARIVKPIFIIGLERSGTTLLYSILANHPECYWLSRLDSLFPEAPFFSSVVRRLVYSFARPVYAAIPGTISRSSGLIPPSECLPYWRRLFGWGDEENYLIPDDCFDEGDVDYRQVAMLKRDLAKRLVFLGKKRLLLKQPGFSLKIRYWNAVFPDALFVHVVRHPMSNLLSLVKAKEKSGEKFWGTKPPGWRGLTKLDFYEQAALQMKTVLDIVERDIQEMDPLHQRYLQVRFEDLLEIPEQSIDTILKFCALGPAAEVVPAITMIEKPTHSVSSVPKLPPKILEILEELCATYGYQSVSRT